jgi:hypothetical protein
VVAQNKETLGRKRQRCVRPALIVTEFDFENPRSKQLDDCTDLSPLQPAFGEIIDQRDDVKQVDIHLDVHPTLLTKRSK